MRIEDDRLYCYLKGSKLKLAIQDPRVLDALLEVLDVPGVPATLRALSLTDKRDAISAHIYFLRSSRTSMWSRVEAGEVLAASLWRALPRIPLLLEHLFCEGWRRAELQPAVAKWLQRAKLEVFCDVLLGGESLDMLGHREGRFLGRTRTVAVRLLVDLRELRASLEPTAKWQGLTHEVYVACTPAIGASYVDTHAVSTTGHWEPRALEHRVKALGCGLLLVHEDGITRVLEAKRARLGPEQMADVTAAVRLAPVVHSLRPARR